MAENRKLKRSCFQIEMQTELAVTCWINQNLELLTFTILLGLMAVLFLRGDYLGQEENIRNTSKLKHLNILCIDVDYFSIDE